MAAQLLPRRLPRAGAGLAQEKTLGSQPFEGDGTFRADPRTIRRVVAVMSTINAEVDEERLVLCDAQTSRGC